MAKTRSSDIKSISDILGKLEKKARAATPGAWKQNEDRVAGGHETVGLAIPLGKDKYNSHVRIMKFSGNQWEMNSEYVAFANPQTILELADKIDEAGIGLPASLYDLKEKAQAATPGPWRTAKIKLGEDNDIIRTEYKTKENLHGDGKSSAIYGLKKDKKGNILAAKIHEPQNFANAAYIAAINPENMLDLIGQIRKKLEQEA